MINTLKLATDLQANGKMDRDAAEGVALAIADAVKDATRNATSSKLELVINRAVVQLIVANVLIAGIALMIAEAVL